MRRLGFLPVGGCRWVVTFSALLGSSLATGKHCYPKKWVFRPPARALGEVLHREYIFLSDSNLIWVGCVVYLPQDPGFQAKYPSDTGKITVFLAKIQKNCPGGGLTAHFCEKLVQEFFSRTFCPARGPESHQNVVQTGHPRNTENTRYIPGRYRV